mmetsp:Transcript_56036/g.175578  ORF Transcript_56036/g.175578 Transcript_56036/m.175578 type:complete len:94 (+) Transcript_56036:235-516(+)
MPHHHGSTIRSNRVTVERQIGQRRSARTAVTPQRRQMQRWPHGVKAHSRGASMQTQQTSRDARGGERPSGASQASLPAEARRLRAASLLRRAA